MTADRGSTTPAPPATLSAEPAGAQLRVHPGTPLRDFAVDGALLLALMAGSFLLVGGTVLFTRPFWLDELHSVLVASRDTPAQVIRDVAGAADTNTPLFHLAAWGLGRLPGGLTPLKMRVFTFALTWLALAVTAALLRRYVSRGAALTGAVALWAHPLVQEHAVEGRFYGAWLLLSALLAYVSAPPGRTPTLRRDLLVACVSAMLCTIHYFGIFTWTLVAVATIWQALPHVRPAARRMLPMFAGPLALLACTPLYLGQRRTISVATWIPPLSTRQVLEFSIGTFAWAPLVIVLLGLAADHVLRPSTETPPRPSAGSDLRALIALGALPAIVLAFSALVQPTLLPRYALPGMLLWAPLVAFGFAQAGLITRVAVLGLLSLSGLAGTVRLAGNSRAFAAEVRTSQETVRPLAAAGVLLVSPSRHAIYALAGADSALGRSIRFIEWPDSPARRPHPPGSDSATAENLYLLERDIARVHRSLYGFPRAIPAGEVGRADRVVLLSQVNGSTATNAERFNREWLPAHHMRVLAPGVHEFVRTASGVTQAPAGPASAP